MHTIKAASSSLYIERADILEFAAAHPALTIVLAIGACGLLAHICREYLG